MAKYLGVETTNSGKFYFISYNTEDKDRVEQYVKGMGELNLPIWYDYGLKVGRKWEEEIAQHIKDCEAVILFVSKNIFAKRESYVHKEYDMARDFYEKDIYVVMLDQIEKTEVPVRYVPWLVELFQLQCVCAYNFNSVNDCVNQIISALGFAPQIPVKKQKPQDFGETVDFTKNAIKWNDVEIFDDLFKHELEPSKPKLKVEKGKGIPIELLNFLPIANSGIERIANIIEKIYKDYADLDIKVCDVKQGPRFYKFYIDIPTLTTSKKLTGVIDELQNAMEIAGIRIEYDYNLNKTFIEIPMSERSIVPLAEVVESKVFSINKKNELLLPFGENVNGEIIVEDLCKMSHLLIAGTTGMGKSVLTHGFLIGLMIRYTPAEVKFVLADAKMMEYNCYKNSPFLFYNKIANDSETLNEMLENLIGELNRRYEIFSRCNVFNIDEYNGFVNYRFFEKMPKIVVVIDEIADFILTNKDMFESKISALTSRGRVAGIHFIMATQRPSVDVITSSIKANIPSRIAFKVTSQADSLIILNESGAQYLSKAGDMLYKNIRMPKLNRCQASFVSKEEINAVVEYVNEYYSCWNGNENTKGELPLELEVLKWAIEKQRISISEIQRYFSVGFSRASRVFEWLKQENYITIVSARKIVINITMEEFIKKFES